MISETDGNGAPLSQRQQRRNRVRAAADAKAAEQIPVRTSKINGRPRALDPDQAIFDKTLQTIIGAGTINCTKQETAAMLGVSIDTLTEFFVRYPEALEKYEDAKSIGVASVRRHQFTLSEKSPQMAIHLGEQLGGQRDPYKMREIEQRERALDLRERDVAARERALELKIPDASGFSQIDIRSLTLVQLGQLAERIRTEITRPQEIAGKVA